ncbi:hypothetical protein [Bordetella phage vB_BbrS_PHB09]|nr:hypothetical protein [Bordetella phage vB_BbrS_PHB09]
MIHIAERWFSTYKGAGGVEFLHTHLQHFASSVEAAHRAWDSHAENSWTAASKWSIETVKHLAIINVAGIAGAAALFNQSASTGLRVSLTAFMAGLVLAVLDFWLVGTGYEKRADGAHKRARIVKGVGSWEEYVQVESVRYKDAGEKWFHAAERVGWSSALAAIVGGASLCVTLMLQ